MKVWVFSVYIRQFNRDQVLNHVVCRRESSSQEHRNYINDPLMKLGKPQHLLLDFYTAMLNDPLHLFVNEFNTSQGWFFQSTDLSLDE